LRQDVAVDVRPDEILIQLPHAELSGIEEKNVDVLTSENGLWNRITGADLQNELAQTSGKWRGVRPWKSILPAEAEKELQRQLTKPNPRAPGPEACLHQRAPDRIAGTNQ